MTLRLLHSPLGVPGLCEVAIVLEGAHPVRGMRQEPVSLCSSPFLGEETSATVWGRCQGGGEPPVVGGWLWPMTHLAGDHGKAAAHPVVNVPPEPLGATSTYRTPPVSEQGGLARGSHGKQDDGTQPQQAGALWEGDEGKWRTKAQC